MKRTLIAIPTFLSILGGAGCSIAPGHVQREWSASMRELGVFPLYPPREDVFIGDVFLTPEYTAEA